MREYELPEIARRGLVQILGIRRETGTWQIDFKKVVLPGVRIECENGHCR